MLEALPADLRLQMAATIGVENESIELAASQAASGNVALGVSYVTTDIEALESLIAGDFEAAMSVGQRDDVVPIR